MQIVSFKHLLQNSLVCRQGYAVCKVFLPVCVRAGRTGRFVRIVHSSGKTVVANPSLQNLKPPHILVLYCSMPSQPLVLHTSLRFGKKLREGASHFTVLRPRVGRIQHLRSRLGWWFLHCSSSAGGGVTRSLGSAGVVRLSAPLHGAPRIARLLTQMPRTQKVSIPGNKEGAE